MAARSSPVMACARMSCQIGALGERELHCSVEELTSISGSMRPPEDCVNFTTTKIFSGSDWSLIPAYANRCREEGGGECQADPQTRTSEEMTGSEVGHRIYWGGTRRRVGCCAAAQAVHKHGGQIGSVEGNLLDGADGEQG